MPSGCPLLSGQLVLRRGLGVVRRTLLPVTTGPLVVLVVLVGASATIAAQDAARQPGRATSAAAADNPVIATIDGYAIRLKDLDQRWRDQDPGSFAHVQQEQYESRRRALDSIIGLYLVEQEAARRGTTVDKLLENELPKRMATPSEAQILEAYTASGLSAQGISLGDARESLTEAWSRQQNKSAALARYLDELRSAARDLNVAFDAPRQPIPMAPTDRILGADDAVVTLVEYGDFQCPFCRATTPVIKRLMAEHKGRLRLVWKDSPLPSHPDARPAAEAARCAADQGKFWDYHDKLYDNQKSLSKGKLKDYAKQVKLDQAAFESCVNAGTHAKAIQTAVDEAAKMGVTATPTIFINGRMVVGALPYDAFERIVQDELARASVK
jgi:protein-disulfide isomerase